jgi:HD-GYP domain-containing protein (c-di-GMP phosphodiesterase class II)
MEQLAHAEGRPDELPAGLRIKQLEENIRHIEGAVVCALNQLLDLRDLSTGYHSTRLAEWAVRIAVDLGLDERQQRNVEVACILHDIGKIGIPDAVLHKERDLTPEERQQMKRHPEFGWAILRLFPGLSLAALFALHHHEHFDGSGYPGGLKGEEIPLGARIVAVIDAFDAMVSDRCYRKGLPLAEAIARLQAGSGAQFDPRIVEHFIGIARRNLVEVHELTAPGRPAA